MGIEHGELLRTSLERLKQGKALELASKRVAADLVSFVASKGNGHDSRNGGNGDLETQERQLLGDAAEALQTGHYSGMLDGDARAAAGETLRGIKTGIIYRRDSRFNFSKNGSR